MEGEGVRHPLSLRRGQSVGTDQTGGCPAPIRAARAAGICTPLLGGVLVMAGQGNFSRAIPIGSGGRGRVRRRRGGGERRAASLSGGEG